MRQIYVFANLRYIMETDTNVLLKFDISFKTSFRKKGLMFFYEIKPVRKRGCRTGSSRVVLSQFITNIDRLVEKKHVLRHKQYWKKSIDVDILCCLKTCFWLLKEFFDRTETPLNPSHVNKDVKWNSLITHMCIRASSLVAHLIEPSNERCNLIVLIP